jgi:hypothetical protein
MYWRDHNPAHFHARYGDFEALIRIDTLEVIRGSLPRRALALVLEWASEHRLELNEDWDCAVHSRRRNRSLPWNDIMIAWSVTALKVLPGHRLEVEFADGLEGVVDMSKDDFSGVFGPLANESYFALATIRDGVVVWPNGVDIAPDAMYDEVNGSRPGVAA